VRVQAPVRLSPHWMPEPDVALVRLDAPADRQPAAGRSAAGVEVSDTSLAEDRGEKLAQYARSGVQVVWIVDLNGRSVEVDAALSVGQYGDVRVYRPGEAMRSRLPGEALPSTRSSVSERELIRAGRGANGRRRLGRRVA